MDIYYRFRDININRDLSILSDSERNLRVLDDEFNGKIISIAPFDNPYKEVSINVDKSIDKIEYVWKTDSILFTSEKELYHHNGDVTIKVDIKSDDQLVGVIPSPFKDMAFVIFDSGVYFFD